LCLLVLPPSLQVHADSVTVQQQRLSFSRPDGSSGSITVTPTHLVYKLTGDTPLTHSAGSVNACERASTMHTAWEGASLYLDTRARIQEHAHLSASIYLLLLPSLPCCCSWVLQAAGCQGRGAR
jgi:hypothetical protein